jgi:hypothetical protein
MLPDQATQLLTAFVDRELSQRQRKAVMRLLHKSSEAREMLRQLQENAHKLKQLPRHKIEPSLVDEILRAIAEQQAQPKQPVVKAVRRRWLPYIAASMAAALLMGALGIVYWTTVVEPGGAKKQGVVKNNPPEKEPPAPMPRQVDRMVDQIVGDTFAAFSKPVPSDLIFTAKFSEFAAAYDMKSERLQELKHEIERVSRDDKAMQFDITVESNVEAMFLLRFVLTDLKIRIGTDPWPYKPIDDKKAQYLFYADNVTSDQVTQMMCLMGKDPQKSSKGAMNEKSVPSTYQKVAVTPLAKDSADIARVAPKRQAPQAGKLQILIRIHQD